MDLSLLARKTDESNRQYAYRVLRYNIMTLRLPPGTSVKEADLSPLLGMSRTPVHEAVIQLKSEHLIDVVPQSGSKVTKIDLDLMKEGYFIRATLEPVILERMAGRLPLGNLSHLQDLLNKQQEILRLPEGQDDFLSYDDAFHREIYRLASMENTWQSVKGLCSHYDRVRYLDSMRHSPHLERIVAEHEQMFQMLQFGIGAKEDVHSFYQQHLEIYREDFSGIQKEFSGYFQ